MTTRMLNIILRIFQALKIIEGDKEEDSDNTDDVDESGQIGRLKTWRVLYFFSFVILNSSY